MKQKPSADALASARYHVPNLARALSVLEHLSELPTGAGVSEISAALGQPKSTVFRILTTLVDYGYVERDDDRNVYRVGRKLLSLGYAAVDAGSLIQQALPSMRTLRDATQETTLLGVLSEGQGLVLEQVSSRHAVKVHVEVGHRFPLHTAAPAKAMLAFMPLAQRDELIKRIRFRRYTEQTITSAKAFRAELDLTRERGYALDRGEELIDLACAAAPLWNRHGEPTASVWITGPRSRLDDPSLIACGVAVCKAAMEIMRRIAASVPREYLVTVDTLMAPLAGKDARGKG